MSLHSICYRVSLVDWVLRIREAFARGAGSTLELARTGDLLDRLPGRSAEWTWQAA